MGGMGRLHERMLHLLAEARAEERLLGQILLKKQYITPTQLKSCLEDQRRSSDAGRPEWLGQTLLRRGVVTAEQIAESLAHQRPDPAPFEGGFGIGKYLVKRVIAKGGMGTVYEAEDPVLKRRIALKVVREGQAGPILVERLHREASAAAKLRHPNIVTVHEVGTVRAGSGAVVHFIAMDFVDGVTLAEALREMNRRERVRALEIVARAVGYAHQEGVIHRDLKPQNVLVEKSADAASDEFGWNLFLTDFGLAKLEEGEDLTRTGSVLGTPHYMAPEQAKGEAKRVGPGTDVWGLGVMLYEMLTNRRLFDGETALQIYEKIVASDLPTLRKSDRTIPPDLETICQKALERDPGRRYVDGTALAEDLARWLAGEPVRARPISLWEKLRRRVAKNRALSAAVGLMVLVAGIGVLALTYQGVSARRKLEADQELYRRREAALQQLSTLGASLTERAHELRQSRRPPAQARTELAAAVEAVNAYIRDWPDSPQGYFVRARGRIYLGDYEGAEMDLKTALKLKPDFRPGWSLLGLLKFEQFRQRQLGIPETHRLREYDRAVLRLEANHALASGWEEGGARAALELWGLTWTREDQILERIVRVLRTSGIDQRPEVARRLLVEGVSEYRAEEYAVHLAFWVETPQERTQWCSQAIAWARGFEWAYLERGRLAYEAREFGKAVEDCGLVLELNPDRVEAYLLRAESRRRLGAPAAAIGDCDSFIRRRRDSAEIYFLRGTCKAATGDHEGAVEDFSTALRLRKDFHEARAHRGKSRIETGDLAAAVKDLEEALRLTRPDWRWRKETEAWLEEARSRGGKR